MKNPTYMLAWTMIVLALITSQSPAQSTYEPYTFTTLAGNAGYGKFDAPSGVAVDSQGNVYVADAENSTIRKVAPTREVTTLGGLTGSVGSADGTGSAARLFHPQGVAVDSAGNVYVADTGNNTIRKGYRVAPAAFHLLGPHLGSNGGNFGFNLTGPSGQFVVVEISTDLMSWLPIWTNTFVGDLVFSDTQIGGASNRFYRARLP